MSKRKKNKNKKYYAGFRGQVFSDNNQLSKSKSKNIVASYNPNTLETYKPNSKQSKLYDFINFADVVKQKPKYKNSSLGTFSTGASPRLRVGISVWEKIYHWVQASPGEISGFGKVEKTGVCTYDVVDVRIFEQVVTGAHTTINADTIAKFMMELITANEKPELWNLWWHSHNTFAVGWSGEDNNTIDDLCETCPELLSMCVNKYGDSTGRHDTSKKKIFMPISIFPDREKCAVKRACKAEVKRKVKDGGGYFGNVFHKTTGLTKDEQAKRDEVELDRSGGHRELYSSDLM